MPPGQDVMSSASNKYRSLSSSTLGTSLKYPITPKVSIRPNVIIDDYSPSSGPGRTSGPGVGSKLVAGSGLGLGKGQRTSFHLLGSLSTPRGSGVSPPKFRVQTETVLQSPDPSSASVEELHRTVSPF